MDVSRDQEHDRTHLRDLLTPSARSLVSLVMGVGKRGSFLTPKGFGHVTHFNANAIHTDQSQNLVNLLQHTQTLLPPAQRFPGIEEAGSSSFQFRHNDPAKSRGRPYHPRGRTVPRLRCWLKPQNRSYIIMMGSSGGRGNHEVAPRFSDRRLDGMRLSSGRTFPCQ
jgi:hypothetical protein